MNRKPFQFYCLQLTTFMLEVVWIGNNIQIKHLVVACASYFGAPHAPFGSVMF